MAFVYRGKGQTAASTASTVSVTQVVHASCVLATASVAITGNSVFPSGPFTFDGNTMTLVDTNTSAEGSTMLFYALNDDVGTGDSITCSIDNGQNDEMTVVVSVFSISTAGKIAAYDTDNKANGVSSGPAVTVSSTSSPGVVVDSMFSGHDSTSGFTGNRTLLYINDTGAEVNASQYYINAVGGSPIMSWSYLGLTDDWNIIGCSFKEITAPSGIVEINTVAWGSVKEMDTITQGNIVEIDTVAT